MNIVFVCSEILQMPSIVLALAKMGHDVEMYPKPAERLEDYDEYGQQMEAYLKRKKVDFVLSNIFIKTVAKITNQLEMKYAVWCMDSPTYSTWVPESEYDNCYLFYFDYRECELKRQSGCSNVYHLPLAGDVAWGGTLVITDEEIAKFACDMSFVGGMYTKNPYDQMIERFSPEQQSTFTDIIEKSAFIWDGRERLSMPPELVRAVRNKCPEMFNKFHEISDEYRVRTYFMGRKLTNVERTLLMELLAQQYDIHLYARNDDIVPAGVRRFPEIPAIKEASKIFYSSKINLNITLRSIASGVPARVYDVMSVGGFMLSNWQEEIPELFVEGKEIATYRTPEELLDKADYYLRHEDERIRIGINGYRKVKEQYTYEHRIEKIISILYPTP